MTTWAPWREAMDRALYGSGGFYRGVAAPAAHFRTAAHTSPQWAQALARLAARVDDALGRPDRFELVEIGAGGGELLTALSEHAPQRWQLVGVDLCARPAVLPARVGWQESLPASVDGLLLAVEWLDVVPCDVAELAEDGVRTVEVALDGAERLGPPVDPAAAEWLHRWWPLADVGDRAEIGVTRDEAWAGAVARLGRGVAVAVDYAADPRRDVAGTLTGYREGRQVLPVPDTSCDLTAHVLMRSCAAAAAADATAVLRQREALRALGTSAPRPSYDGDPRAYLQALQRTGEAAELLDPDGLGGFTWLVQAKGIPLPLE